MDELIAQVGRYGLLLIFANVFLEQIGAPIPALPTLIVAGVLGALFQDAVADAVGYLETLGLWALAVLGAGLLLVIAAKWWQRRRLFKILRLARISVPELHTLIEQGDAPVIVDVRTRTRHLLDPRRIPGAVRMSIDELDEKLAELPRDREIILYCT